MKKVIYTREALRGLESAPIHIARQIKAKLALYAENPEALANNVTAMQGRQFKGLLRLRVGDWRVVFTEAGEVIAVEKIGRRSDIYRIYN